MKLPPLTDQDVCKTRFILAQWMDGNMSLAKAITVGLRTERAVALRSEGPRYYFRNQRGPGRRPRL